MVSNIQFAYSSSGIASFTPKEFKVEYSALEGDGKVGSVYLGFLVAAY